MTGLLYFLAIVIIFHNLLLLFTLFRQPQAERLWWSIFQEVAMIAAAVLAIIFASWPILVVGFAVYRFCLTIHSAILIWFQRRATSPVLAVNLLMIAGAVVAFATHWWWIFPVTYGFFWIFSFFLARKAMQRGLPTS